MKTLAVAATTALHCAALAGCAQHAGHRRTVQVRSAPPGAVVRINGAEIGATPATFVCTHPGVYDVQLRLPGYAAAQEGKRIDAGWFDRPPLDAFPYRTDAHSVWEFTLEPLSTNTDALLERGRAVRGAHTPEEPD